MSDGRRLTSGLNGNARRSVPRLEDLSALILAGGLGSRLSTVVSDKPKVLAEVNGRPFLSILLTQVEQAGLRHAVICTGHKGEQVRAILGESSGSVRLSYSHEPSPLGTAGALRPALSAAQSDPVLVLNGDSYVDADFERLYQFHTDSRADGTILLTRVPDAGRFGQVQTDENGRIVRFAEKGSLQGPGWINAGIYVLSGRLIAGVPAGRPVSIETEMFPAWTRERLYGHRQEGRFLDIGTPESYAAASRFFSGPSPS